jgi:hypothetical protein
MRRLTFSLAAALLLATTVLAQRNAPASKEELAEISARGRVLAEYDVAAWHATDAVMALSPPQGSVARYIAKKDGSVWTVVFGRLNEKKDKFLIVYEAIQGVSPVEFKVTKHEPPKEDTGFYLGAAKAIETAVADFKGESRPYNVAVLPAKSDQLYVYVVPAQTDARVFPLGGDARYLISADGTAIMEKRRLHNAILEFASSPDQGTVESGFHTAVLDDVPEDTDVFFVLSRKPNVPELIRTRKYVYRIERDGTINYLLTAEAFGKILEDQQRRHPPSAQKPPKP